MDIVVVYLMAEPHIQNDKNILCMNDICDILCQNRELQAYLQRLPVQGVQPDDNGRSILSVLDIIEAMLHAAGQRFPKLQLQCENLGAQQIIIERSLPKTKRWIEWLKVGFSSLIVFLGAAFTIMTYNQDVDVTGVFGRIYELVLGDVTGQPWILEATYALGVAVGVILFFNPFTSSRQRKEPSPIEIEMEKYETDIQDTIVKLNQRSANGPKGR